MDGSFPWLFRIALIAESPSDSAAAANLAALLQTVVTLIVAAAGVLLVSVSGDLERQIGGNTYLSADVTVRMRVVL
jgi:hypothetical protein